MAKTEPAMLLRLREEITKLGWSDTDIADELRCSKESVSTWRSGVGFPGPVFLRDLYELGCDIMYILTGERSNAKQS